MVNDYKDEETFFSIIPVIERFVLFYLDSPPVTDDKWACTAPVAILSVLSGLLLFILIGLAIYPYCRTRCRNIIFIPRTERRYVVNGNAADENGNSSHGEDYNGKESVGDGKRDVEAPDAKGSCLHYGVPENDDENGDIMLDTPVEL